MKDKHKTIVIAIDGPAGSGKSTVSKRIAKRLGLVYVDTGAMYRALTLKAIRKAMNLEDEGPLVSLARSTKIDLERGQDLKVLLDGEDVSSLIRTPEVTGCVKFIARVPGVRKEMVKLQRSIGRRYGAILEGRDITTVVFPDADYKFYLDADADERARRRHKELAASGEPAELKDVKADMAARDESDMNRAAGPLKKTADAVLIDTTNLSIDGVAEELIRRIEELKTACQG